MTGRPEETLMKHPVGPRTSHLHPLHLLEAAVPGDEPAVFPSGHQGAVPQHAQSEDAAFVSALDHMADSVHA